MKPTDFRDLTFDKLRKDLSRQRESVYAAWQIYGPGTTRHVAGEAGIDILSLRPRTTELLELGLLAVVDPDFVRSEGVYRVTTPAEWETFRLGQIERQLRLI
jgi:hypothetical protein